MSKWFAAFTLTAVGFAAPVSASAQADSVSAQEVTVEAVLATDVVDMEPVGEATEFSADVGRVHCWTRVTGATGTSIEHVWIHPDGQRTPVSLEVGGSPWRTWSSKAIPPEWAGEWSVEIRDAAGNVLETLQFVVGM